MDNSSPDLFINQVTYLPFDEVVKLCSANKQFRTYCNDVNYSQRWEALIRNTFGDVFDYQTHVKEIQDKLKINHYNYLIYTQLIKLLDPITQLMIYYKQGDMDKFNTLFNKTDRNYALFLLNKITKSSILNKLLRNETLQPEILSKILNDLTRQGNVQGMLKLKSLGAPFNPDELLILAVESDNLNVVKYLTEHENITNIDQVFKQASYSNNLPIMKYLISKGVDVNTEYGNALRWAILDGNLDIVKYLISVGADPNVDTRMFTKPLTIASERGDFEIVKYLVEQGANIHHNYEEALRNAIINNKLGIVKYLISKGADIHVQDDWPIKQANATHNIDIINYLNSLIKQEKRGKRK